MKKIILSLVSVFVVSTQLLLANDDKYVEAMKRNIKAIYDATSIDSYQQSVNAFEMIASAEKSHWEPLYYVAFGNVMMANLATDNVKKDGYLDRAMEAIDQARAVKQNESEIVALEGFVYMLRIAIDPQSRGMEYAPQAVATFNRAVALNPENPRALALLAQMQFGSAQFFGSPTAESCEINAKAADKFETYKSDNELAPVWGKRMVESLKQKCQ